MGVSRANCNSAITVSRAKTGPPSTDRCESLKVPAFSGGISLEIFPTSEMVFQIKVCAKVCADENGRLSVARKLLKILVPARRLELLTPRV